MREVREKTRLVCARYNRQSNLNRLLPNIHCRTLAELIWNRNGCLQLLPVLIVTSSAATKSVKTASTSSNPARTFIISELALVYFFERTEVRKAVMVWNHQPRLVPRDALGLTSRACASAG